MEQRTGGEKKNGEIAVGLVKPTQGNCEKRPGAGEKEENHV